MILSFCADMMILKAKRKVKNVRAEVQFETLKENI